MSALTSAFTTLYARRCSVIPSFAGVLLLCAVTSGCSSENFPPCHPARGQVLLDGKPLADAVIVFHPASGHEVLQNPIAQSDANGQFVVTTFKPGDGAPAGEYRVTVELRELRLVGEEQVRDGPNLLTQQFAAKEKTPLSVQIQEGDNQLAPLAVTKR